MRLLVLDYENKETTLYVNPAFTVETVKLMYCEKVGLDAGNLVFIIKRSEVSFGEIMKIFSIASLSPYCDYRPLMNEMRIRELPCLQDVFIRAVSVTPLEINIECKFLDGMRSVSVDVDRTAATGALVNKVASCLSTHVHQRYVQLFFCGIHLSNMSLPLYAYGIIYPVTVQGRLAENTQEKKMFIQDLDSAENSCVVFVPATVTVKTLMDKIREASGDNQDFVLIWNGNELVNPRFVIQVRESDRFMKIKRN